MSTRYATLTTHIVGRDRQSCMSRSAHTDKEPRVPSRDGQGTRPVHSDEGPATHFVLRTRAYVCVEQEAVRLDTDERDRERGWGRGEPVVAFDGQTRHTEIIPQMHVW